MKNKYIIMTSLIACVLLYFVEQVIEVDYFIKTFVKLVLFIGVPYFYIKHIKKQSISKALNLRKMKKKDIMLGIIFGVASFIIIIITYSILKGYIDTQSIVAEMQDKSKITPVNFIFVGLYITFGNSFLEEMFFRGYIFLNLYESGQKKFAYVFSSTLFGLYHIAIFKNWFNIGLILLAMVGLIGVGFIFNWLDTKSKNFINSWIVHVLADSAIIFIGMKLLKIV